MARGFQYLSKVDPLQPLVAADWQQAWEPQSKPRIAPVLAVALVASGLFAAPVQPEAAPVSIGWHQALSEPVRAPIIPITTWEYTSPLVTIQAAVGGVASAVSVGVTYEARVQYQGYTAPVFVAPEEVTSDKWFNPLSEPQRDKLRLLAGAQPHLFLVQAAPFEETVTESRWHQPWSEPLRPKPGLAATQQQTLAFYPNPTVSFGWFGNLSDPSVLSKIGLRASLQQAATIDPYALTQPEAVLESKWHQPWSEPVRVKLGLLAALQQSLAWNTVFTAPEVITVDKWWEPWSDPTRPKWSPKTYPSIGFLAPQPQVSFGWFESLSDPVRIKNGAVAANQQFFTTSPNPIVSFGWFGSLVDPAKPKASVRTAGQQTSTVDADPTVSFSWFAPLPEPVRSKPRVAWQQFTTLDPYGLTQPETVTESRWHRPWPDIVYAKKTILAAQQQFLAFDPSPISGELVTVDKWIYPFTGPVRLKPGLAAARQQFLAAEPFSLTRPETVTESRWHQPWSEPQRRRRTQTQQALAWGNNTPAATSVDQWFRPFVEPVRIRASVQRQFLAFAPNPVVSFGWFGGLSQPAKAKPSPRDTSSVYPPSVEAITPDKWLRPLNEPVRRRHTTQDLQVAAPSQIVSFGWFGWLESPIRTRSGLLAAEQQSFTQDLVVPVQPITVGNWFSSFSEPTRFRSGLGTRFQQTISWPPRLLPTSVIVTMAAVEDNQDVFEGIITTAAPATRCLVSIEEISVPNRSPTSIHEEDQ